MFVELLSQRHYGIGIVGLSKAGGGAESRYFEDNGSVRGQGWVLQNDVVRFELENFAVRVIPIYLVEMEINGTD